MTAAPARSNMLSFLSNTSLVLASHNRGKAEEIKKLLEPLGLQIAIPLGVRLVGNKLIKIDEPEETGDSFAENATLKSESACNATGLPALSDDSGLVVPAIGGAPGIYSARWAGPNKDFSAAFERIRKELDDLPAHAYFISVLALSIPGRPVELFEGRIDGTLTFPPRGDKGFGYDPIFIPEGHSVTFAELDPDYKNSISHRARAFAKFLDFLKEAA